MKIKIRHDNRELGLNLLCRNQMRNDARRHEMRANGNVRIKIPDKFHQRTRIQAVDHVPHCIRAPRFIACLVPPPQKIGC